MSRGQATWQVKGKGFGWERSLRKGDRLALGDAAPDGPILGAMVEHLGAKEALLQNAPGPFFTTPHFDGYAAVLVRLEEIDATLLQESILEAWLARAPARLKQPDREDRTARARHVEVHPRRDVDEQDPRSPARAAGVRPPLSGWRAGVGLRGGSGSPV